MYMVCRKCHSRLIWCTCSHMRVNGYRDYISLKFCIFLLVVKWRQWCAAQWFDCFCFFKPLAPSVASFSLEFCINGLIWFTFVTIEKVWIEWWIEYMPKTEQTNRRIHSLEYRINVDLGYCSCQLQRFFFLSFLNESREIDTLAVFTKCVPRLGLHMWTQIFFYLLLSTSINLNIFASLIILVPLVVNIRVHLRQWNIFHFCDT